MTKVYAEIDAKILFIGLKAAFQVVDEVNLCFTQEGLSVRQLDMGEVSMVDLFVPRGLFEGYQIFEAEKHIVTTRISDIQKLFKRPKKGDRVTIAHEGSENMLSLALRGEVGVTTFKVPVFSSGDAKELPLPKVNLTEKFTTRTKAVADFLNGARHITDSVRFTCSGQSMLLEAKGEISSVQQELTMGDGTLVDYSFSNTDMNQSYDLNRLLKFFQKDFGETATVALAKDLPIRIDYALSTNDYRDKAQITYYVAPRVDRDEPSTPKTQTECDSCGLKFESVYVEEVDGKTMDLCEKCRAEVKEGKRPWIQEPQPQEPVVEETKPEEPTVEEKPPEPQIVEQQKPVVQEAPDPLAAFKQKYRKPSPY